MNKKYTSEYKNNKNSLFLEYKNSHSKWRHSLFLPIINEI